VKLFTTPEARRRYGEALWTFDPSTALRFIARAYLEEHDGMAKFEASHAAWKDAEPQAIDFMPASAALPLMDKYNESAAAVRAKLNAMWGVS
jgi:hypothetical protein